MNPRICPGCRSPGGEHNFGAGCTLACDWCERVCPRDLMDAGEALRDDSVRGQSICGECHDEGSALRRQHPALRRHGGVMTAARKPTQTPHAAAKLLSHSRRPCAGQGCGRLTPPEELVDGVCALCAEREAACEHCGVVSDRAVMERVDPHDLVCGACADVAHREQEARESDYGPVALSEAEEWV